MKKNGDANNNPVLIIVLAVIFSLGGLLGVVLNLVNNFDTLFFIISLLLLIVGIIFFVFGTIRRKSIKRIKKLEEDSKAFQTTATFVKAKFSSFKSSSVSVGNVTLPTSFSIYKKVIYKYVDQNGQEHTAKSTLSYTPKQVRYLQEKNIFNIKCDGEVSIIIEELPSEDSLLNV